MRCDAMPSDDANSGILMDMSQSIQGCFVHTVWASKPINGVAFHQLSWYWQQNSALATFLIDVDTRIRITLISCLNQLRMSLLLTDLIDVVGSSMALYIWCWCTGLHKCIPYLTLDHQVSDSTKQMAHGVRDKGMTRVYKVILIPRLP